MVSLNSQDPIERLLAASKSTSNVALNILLVNVHKLLRFDVFGGQERLGIVRVKGPKAQIEERISLAKSRFEMIEAAPFFELLPSYLEQLDSLKTLTTGITPQQIRKLCLELFDFKAHAYVSLLQPKLIEFISAVMLEALIDQSHSLPFCLQQPSVLDALQRLRLIHPYLEVALCSRCGQFSLLFGTFPIGGDKCSQCSSELTCAGVFLVDSTLCELKKDNNRDLALFISKFLNSASAGQILTEPSKCFPPDTEIDVYLGQSKTAIECRLYLNPEINRSEQEIRSRAGELKKEIKSKCDNSGAQQFYYVTNLPESECASLEQEIRKQLAEDGSSISATVLPGDVDIILRRLQELCRES